MKRVWGEIQSIVTEIRDIKREMKSFNGFLQIPVNDSHKKEICQVLDMRIDLLLDLLQKIAEGNGRA